MRYISRIALCCMILVLTLPVIAHTACIEPPSGMIGWWGGDGNAKDYMGQYNGFTQYDATFGTGKVGQAFSLDGTDDYIDIPYNTYLNPCFITVDAWFYATDITGQTHPPIVKNTDGTTGYALEINSGTSQLKFWVNISGTWYQSAAVTVTTNTWYHAAGTYDGSELRLYLNGQLQGSPVSVAGAINPSLSSSLNIGRDPSNTNRVFEGFIDEVEIFNRALSATEIAALYNADSDGKCKKPLLSCIPIAENPPVINGALSVNEWPSSPQITLNTPDYPIQTDFYCMNDGTNLYILVDAIGDDTDDNAGTPCANNTYNCDECLLVFGDSNQTTNYMAEVWGTAGYIKGTNTSLPAGTEVAIGYNGHRFYEWKIPLNSINATPGQPIDFSSPKLCKGAGGEEYCLSMPYDGSTQRDNEWPLGVDTDNRDRWAQLQLGRAIPTLTEWGMITFIVLAGLGSVYYLRRRKRAEK